MNRTYPALALLLTDVWFAMMYARHGRLRATYECGYSDQPPCVADFDGDGRPTSIQISHRSDKQVELPPVFVGRGQELARLNAFSMDNTFRTHVAVRGGASGARLLVYDGARWRGRELTPPVRAVYAWDGEKLAEVGPAEIDTEILSAMEARDDTGTFDWWITYRLLTWPVRVVYGLSFVLVSLLYIRHRRAERKLR